MEKADILLKAHEEAPIFTADPRSIQNWLEKSTLDSSSLSIEICHPLATPPHTVLHEETDSLVSKENTLAGKIKEEPMSPGGIQPTPGSVRSAETPPKETSVNPKKQTKASPPSGRSQPLGAIAPTVAPQKSKVKTRGLSVLAIPPEVNLLASSRKPKATSTLQKPRSAV